MTAHKTFSFPEELLVMIISNIQHVPTLTSVARVSRQLNRVTTPSIYTHISLDFNHCDPRKLQKLMTTCSTISHLATTIRAVTIRGTYRFPSKVTWDTIIDTTVTPAHVCEAVGTLSKDDSQYEEWLNEANNRRKEDAIVALFLALLPNLYRLDWEVEAWNGPWFHRVMKVLCEGSAFQNVQEVLFCAARANANSYTRSVVKSLFLMPSIQKLCVFARGNERPKPQDLNIPVMIKDGKLRVKDALQPLVPIRHFEVRQGDYGVADLFNNLSRIQALETFMYETYYPFTSVYFSLSDLTQLLSIHSESLRELALEYPRCEMFYSPMQLETFSLHHFPRLEHLKMSEILLFGDLRESRAGRLIYTHMKRILPPSLQKLTLTSCMPYSKDFFPLLRQVIQGKHQFYPELSAIEIKVNIAKSWPGLWKTDSYYGTISEAKSNALEAFASIHNVSISIVQITHVPDNHIERGWGMEEDEEWALCHQGLNGTGEIHRQSEWAQGDDGNGPDESLLKTPPPSDSEEDSSQSQDNDQLLEANDGLHDLIHADF